MKNLLTKALFILLLFSTTTYSKKAYKTKPRPLAKKTCQTKSLTEAWKAIKECWREAMEVRRKVEAHEIMEILREIKAREAKEAVRKTDETIEYIRRQMILCILSNYCPRESLIFLAFAGLGI